LWHWDIVEIIVTKLGHKNTSNKTKIIKMVVILRLN
jgi:hypothetical protein